MVVLPDSPCIIRFLSHSGIDITEKEGEYLLLKE